MGQVVDQGVAMTGFFFMQAIIIRAISSSLIIIVGLHFLNC